MSSKQLQDSEESSVTTLTTGGDVETSAQSRHDLVKKIFLLFLKQLLIEVYIFNCCGQRVAMPLAVKLYFPFINLYLVVHSNR